MFVNMFGVVVVVVVVVFWGGGAIFSICIVNSFPFPKCSPFILEYPTLCLNF